MKAAELVLQLQQTLPKYTDLFSDIVSVDSVTRTGSTVTVITTVPHGLSNGDIITINGALTPINIISIVQTNGIATATTSSPHDFTDNYTETVNIIGADQIEYNGIHPFIHQPNRYTFKFSITGNPISPATGTIYLLENLKQGYNGSHIITYVDDTTFTYQISSTPASPAQGNITISKNHRISDALSIERFLESYTPQENNKLWAVVCLGTSSASKDRFVLTDNTAINTPGADYRQRIIENISIYIVVPTKEEISGAIARDLMQDLAHIIFKSCLRFYTPSGFDDKTKYGLIFSGHGETEYKYAYYVHQFNFEYTYDITYNDTIDTDNSVAFRDIELNFLNKLSRVIAQTNINLDDEPV